jgi:hypothetical protein
VTNDRRNIEMGRKMILAAGVLAAIALPASAAAKPPTKADKRHAAKECRAERGTDDATQEAFKTKYKNFGACVSARAKQEKAERQEARSNAAKDCRAERAEDVDAFRDKYGTNHNKRNAFGKCVSQKAKAEKAKEDDADQQEIEETHNAAQECATERDQDAAAFQDKYGTNHNKKNAFGKCVSGKSKGGDDDGGNDSP